MKFEWDAIKASKNLKKQGISFDIAITVFDDPFHLSIVDDRHDQEDRWITVGVSADRLALVVVHVYREVVDGGEIIRIISARRATSREKRQYEKGI